jgi:hypothetical protein
LNLLVAPVSMVPFSHQEHQVAVVVLDSQAVQVDRNHPSMVSLMIEDVDASQTMAVSAPTGHIRGA